MKKLYLSIFLLTLLLNSMAQSLVTTGITIEEFNKIYPMLKSSTFQEKSTFQKPEIINGVDGNWEYSFENNKLTNFNFSSYNDEIDEDNFAKSLAAIKQIIADYSQAFGKPSETAVGDTTFVDPYIKRHFGYNVIEAQWSNANSMKIKTSFNFFGGKGEYYFIIEIKCFDKDYPNLD